MNVLLIAPTEPAYKPFTEMITFPAGIAYISAVLKKAGHNVVCVNAYLLTEGMEEHLKKLAVNNDFNIVGIGGMSVMYVNVKKTVDYIRTIFPKAQIVLGGNIVTCMPEKIMSAMSVDFGVLGEGEITVVELLQVLQQGGNIYNVPGLAINNRERGEIVITPNRACIPDLDTIPFPDYEGFGFKEQLNRMVPAPGIFQGSGDDYPRIANVHASRSCPFQCTFCYHAPGQKYRQRSLDNCFAEIDYLIEHYNINTISLEDELFFNPNQPERLFDFCRRIKERRLKWSCQLKVTGITGEVLAAMKDAGCESVSYGIEHVSDRILKSMRKGITKAQIEQALALTYENELDIQGNLIFGDLEETWETFLKAYCWAQANQRYLLSLVSILVVPNSHLYLTALKSGIITDEIAYIQSEQIASFAINVTKMPLHEYEMMRKLLRQRDVCSYYPGIIKSYELLGVDEHTRKCFRLEVWCPHCGKLSNYGRLFFFPLGPDVDPMLDDIYKVIYCRQCTRRFHICNVSLWSDEPNLPKRMFITHYPPRRLLELYVASGGSIKNLAEFAQSRTIGFNTAEGTIPLPS